MDVNVLECLANKISYYSLQSIRVKQTSLKYAKRVLFENRKKRLQTLNKNDFLFA